MENIDKNIEFEKELDSLIDEKREAYYSVHRSEEELAAMPEGERDGYGSRLVRAIDDLLPLLCLKRDIMARAKHTFKHKLKPLAKSGKITFEEAVSDPRFSSVWYNYPRKVRKLFGYDRDYNYVGFPDSIVGGLGKKSFVGKWAGQIVANVKDALAAYYMKENNPLAYNEDAVCDRFDYVSRTCGAISMVVSDLMDGGDGSAFDVVSSVYGPLSDEVYCMKAYISLERRMDEWSTAYMWDGCADNERLRGILDGIEVRQA